VVAKLNRIAIYTPLNEVFPIFNSVSSKLIRSQSHT